MRGRRLAGLLLELAPAGFAVVAFGAGAVMLTSSVAPSFSDRLRLLAEAAPILVIELSHFLASVVGFLLLVVAAGLWRRRRGAYWLALGLLLAGAVFSLLKGLDVEEAAILAGAGAALAPFRRAFDRPSRLAEVAVSRGGLPLVAAVVAAALWLGFFAYRDVAYTDELWWTFLRNAEVSRFLRAGAALAILTLVLTVWVLLSAPDVRRRGRPRPEAVEDAVRALAAADQAGPQAWLAAVGDKDLLFSPSGGSFITFRVRGRRWIAMGEPAGRAAEFGELMWRFAQEADRGGGKSVFYAVSPALLPELAAMGMVLRKVGENAVVDLARFSLEGPARQDLRTARNRLGREGCAVEVLPPGSAAALEGELRAVSDAWLRGRRASEKAFSLGRFDVGYLNRVPLAVVKAQGRIAAFANLLPAPARSEVAVDLMRHAPDAPKLAMDFLFLGAIEWASAEGFARFNLGMTPLAGLDDRRLAPAFARVGAFVFEEGGALYGFRSLRAFKAKFGPDWEPVFMAAAPGVPMTWALLDVALLTSGGWRGLLGLR
ncbi:MAG TPA: phosphatidylglycerol lysyltransferase domain-containing protein [Caulobacteraceae bacterium]